MGASEAEVSETAPEASSFETRPGPVLECLTEVKMECRARKFWGRCLLAVLSALGC